MTRRLTRTGLAALAMALFLTACGGGSAPAPTTSAPTASVTATSPTDTPTPTESSATRLARPTAPSGTKWVVAQKSGVEFVVPKTWTKIDFSTLLKSANTSKIDEIAKSMNLSSSQLASAAKTIDLYIIDPNRTTFASNINTVLTPLLELPSEATIRTGFKSLGMTVSSTSSMTTPVGPGLLVLYRGKVAGQSFHGEGIFVLSENGVVDITVSAATAAKVQTIAKPILATLRAAS